MSEISREDELIRKAEAGDVKALAELIKILLELDKKIQGDLTKLLDEIKTGKKQTLKVQGSYIS